MLWFSHITKHCREKTCSNKSAGDHDGKECRAESYCVQTVHKPKNEIVVIQ